MADESKERIQKVLANAGVSSRREVEQWIRDGKVSVNGTVAKLGDRISDQDRVTVDGKPISERRLSPPAQHLIVYNKPEGEIVSRRDPEGRPTVFRKLPWLTSGRWISIGRLDVNSSGLLLFTTNGELANRLMHPSSQIEREYAVRVHGEVTSAMIEQLVTGVELEDGPARFEDVVESGGEASNRWFHVVIMEGRKREVRRMWEAVGGWVNRLKRVRFGPIILDSSVKAGQWRELDKDERRALLDMVGLRDDNFVPIPPKRPGKRKPAVTKPAATERGYWKKRR